VPIRTAPAATAVASMRRDSGGVVNERRSRPDGGGLLGPLDGDRRIFPPCRRCGAAAEATDRYCGRCGSALATTAAQVERRTVSVLFVDMVGFTGLAAALDPEDVRAVQSEYFHAVSDVIHRWNGVVEKYIGDAVMAIFGAPRSHEYDAYRAVRAALELRHTLSGRRFPTGLQLRTRIGVATGEAVVDLDAARDGSQVLVSGDVVNMASRVQASAAEGTVIVNAATRRATAAFVRYGALPPITVAGKPEPLPVFQACAVERPGAATGRDDSAIPMVGRHRELAAILDRLTLAVSRGVPQLVSIVGHAGTGKSRLVRELARRVGANQEVRWRVGYCSPHGDGRYEPLAQIVREHAGIDEGGDPETIRRQLTTWVRELLGPDGSPAVPDALAVLLGVPGAPASTGSAAAGDDAERAWQRVLLASASQQPLVLVIEDLHRADPAMTRFVRDLFSAAAAAPRPVALAVLVTRRPDLTDVAGARSSDRVPTVFLRPLADVETGRLLHHLLDRAGHPPALVERLLPLVGGNPLYACEYVRALGAAGTDLATPERVRAMLSARIDQLDDLDRAALQAAAVVGHCVWPDALAAVLGTDPQYAHVALQRLEARGLLVRRPNSTVASQPEYAFAEVAVRHTAYGRLPRAVRAERHRRAALWLDAMAESGRSEHDEACARHWVVAHELAQALNWDAGPYLVAARRAFAAAARRAMLEGASGRSRHLAYQALRLSPAAEPADRARSVRRHPVGHAVSRPVRRSPRVRSTAAARQARSP
jgi:class 3 adenylate cyclase